MIGDVEAYIQKPILEVHWVPYVIDGGDGHDNNKK